MGSFTARSTGAGLALCIGVLCADAAMAEGQRTSTGRLGDMLLRSDSRKPATPPVARYVAEGSVAFILDKSSALPLIRFEGSNEIWVLYPQFAPRGDVIYKNDVGEPVLRASRLGGMTVFTATRPEGAAAALDGVGISLRSSGLMQALADARRLGAALAAASGKVSTAAGRPILVDAPDIGPESAVAAVEAANLSAVAFERLRRGERNADALARIEKVLLLEGSKSAAKVDRQALVITVVPGQGAAGRPSSAKIMSALKR